MDRRTAQILELVILANSLLAEYNITGTVVSQDIVDELYLYVDTIAETVVLRNEPGGTMTPPTPGQAVSVAAIQHSMMKQQSQLDEESTAAGNPFDVTEKNTAPGPPNNLAPGEKKPLDLDKGSQNGEASAATTDPHLEIPGIVFHDHFGTKTTTIELEEQLFSDDEESNPFSTSNSGSSSVTESINALDDHLAASENKVSSYENAQGIFDPPSQTLDLSVSIDLDKERECNPFLHEEARAMKDVMLAEIQEVKTKYDPDEAQEDLR